MARSVGSAGADLGDLVGTVDGLDAVAVAVDDQQHRRVDLPDPVDHRGDAELRRARRPHRPEAGAREEGHDRLGHVRQVADDPVATSDAEPTQPRRGAGDLVGELVVAERDLVPGLAASDDRGRAATTTQRVLGVVQRGAGEPHRARHRGIGQHRGRRVDEPHIELVDDLRPERLEVGDRPRVRVGVGRQGHPAAPLDLVEEPTDAGGRARILGRRPQQLARDDLSHLPPSRPVGRDATRRAGSTRPVTSPSATVRPSGPGAPARIVTVSPSSNPSRRTAPSASSTSSVQPQVSSSRLPRSRRVGPDTVPDANRSPVRSDAPLLVRCASCCAGVHRSPAAPGVATHRRTAAPAGASSSSNPIRVPVARRGEVVRRRAGRRPAARPWRPSSASSGTIHGDTDVANDLPRNGPSGRYSNAWRSRALQSLTTTAPMTWSANAVVGTVVPSSLPTPTTQPSSTSTSRWLGRSADHLAAVRVAPQAGRAGPRRSLTPRPSRRGRGSRWGGGPRRPGSDGIVRPEDAADVGRVIARAVEVHVVGDRPGQHGRRPRRAASGGARAGRQRRHLR